MQRTSETNNNGNNGFWCGIGKRNGEYKVLMGKQKNDEILIGEELELSFINDYDTLGIWINNEWFDHIILRKRVLEATGNVWYGIVNFKWKAVDDANDILNTGSFGQVRCYVNGSWTSWHILDRMTVSTHEQEKDIDFTSESNYNNQIFPTKFEFRNNTFGSKVELEYLKINNNEVSHWDGLSENDGLLLESILPSDFIVPGRINFKWKTYSGSTPWFPSFHRHHAYNSWSDQGWREGNFGQVRVYMNNSWTPYLTLSSYSNSGTEYDVYISLENYQVLGGENIPTKFQFKNSTSFSGWQGTAYNDNDRDALVALDYLRVNDIDIPGWDLNTSSLCHPTSPYIVFGTGWFTWSAPIDPGYC